MRFALLAVCALLGLACDAPPPRGKGGSCHSLSDCRAGLACVEGRCSSDVDELAGDVPEYAGEAVPDAGDGDAGGAEAGDGGGSAAGDGG